MSTAVDQAPQDPSQKPLLHDAIEKPGSKTNAINPTTNTNNGNHNNNTGHLHNPNVAFRNANNTANNNANTSGSRMSTSQLKYVQKMEAQIGRLRVWFWATLATCIAAAVIVIVLVAVLYVQLDSSITHHVHKPNVGEYMAAILKTEPLCVRCDDYVLGPSPEESSVLSQFTVKDEPNGHKSCCVDEPEELIELMEMFVEKRLRQERARGTINPWPPSTGTGAQERRPAAHLLMKKQKTDGIKQVPGRMYMITEWVHDADLAFTYLTQYRHGRLVVPEDGFYFVYSQVSFFEYYDMQSGRGYGSRGSDEFATLSHYLYRYNVLYHHGGEEKLAQNSLTKCWGQSKQYGEYTSYLGAVFKLRNADEVFIKVSNLTLVAKDPKLTYFGLYKI